MSEPSDDMPVDGPFTLTGPSDPPVAADMPAEWLSDTRRVRIFLMGQLEQRYGSSNFLNAARWLAVMVLHEGSGCETHRMLLEIIRTPGHRRRRGAMKCMVYLHASHLPDEDLKLALADAERDIRVCALQVIHRQRRASSMAEPVAAMIERLVGTPAQDEEISPLGHVLQATRSPEVLAAMRRVITDDTPESFLWLEVITGLRPWGKLAAELREPLERRILPTEPIGTRLDCLILLSLITDDPAFRTQYVALAEECFAAAFALKTADPAEFAQTHELVVLGAGHPLTGASLAVARLHELLFDPGFDRVLQLVRELGNGGIHVLALCAVQSHEPAPSIAGPVFESALDLILSLRPDQCDGTLETTVVRTAMRFALHLTPLTPKFAALRVYFEQPHSDPEDLHHHDALLTALATPGN